MGYFICAKANNYIAYAPFAWLLLHPSLPVALNRDEHSMARAWGKNRFTFPLRSSSASPSFLFTRIHLTIAVQQTLTTEGYTRPALVLIGVP